MSIQSILKFAFVAATTISTASAFFIPDGTQDGFYMHYIDHNGKDVHRRLDNNPVARRFALREAARNLNSTYMAARPEMAALNQMNKKKNKKRYNSSVGINCSGCGDSYELPNADTDEANDAIDTECGDGQELVAGSDYYSKNSETVAYVCAFQADQQCTAAARQESSSLITNLCGLYMAGWETPNPYGCENGYSGITYGYDHAENCFCFC